MRARVLSARAAGAWLLLTAAGCADFRPGPLAGDDGSGPDDVVVADDDAGDDVRTDTPAGSCAPAGLACDPIAQTGCTAGAQACEASFDADGGAFRVACAAHGAGGEGAACASGAACAAGLSCLDGICHALCCAADSRACSDVVPAARCVVSLGHGAGEAMACGVVCDWSGHTGCASGSQCLPVDAAGHTDCVATGTATTGTHCADGVHRCAAGYACVASTTSSGSFCRRVCDPTMSPDACTSGTCTALDARPASFGACLPP